MAWEILKGEKDGDSDLARHIVKLYDNDNANMFAGRTVQALAEKVLLGDHPISIEEAVELGADMFSQYVPRDWDDGKDKSKHEINRGEFAEVLRAAVDGIQDAASQLGINQLIGETDVYTKLAGCQLPYYGKPDFSQQIELKTKWSTVDQRAKSGKRAASMPKTPTWSHLCQVSGYRAGTNKPQAIVYARAGSNAVYTGRNDDHLTDDGLDAALRHVIAKCKIRENQMKAASSTDELLLLVEPDFGHMWGWDVHPDVLDEAKKLWGFK